METEMKGTLEEKEDLLTIEADHRWAMELIRKNVLTYISTKSKI